VTACGKVPVFDQKKKRKKSKKVAEEREGGKGHAHRSLKTHRYLDKKEKDTAAFLRQGGCASRSFKKGSGRSVFFSPSEMKKTFRRGKKPSLSGGGAPANE